MSSRTRCGTRPSKVPAAKKCSPKKNGRPARGPAARVRADLQEALHNLEVHQAELEMQNEELRRAQTELEASRARYSDLYDLAPVGYCTVSEEGMVQEANLAAARMFGLGRRQLMGRPLTGFILPEDQDLYYRHRRAAMETGVPASCELRMSREGAEFFWVGLETVAGKDWTGAAVCRLAMTDITAHRQAQDRLRAHEAALAKLQSLESLGVLAGGIAHDFNNFMTIIQGNLSLLRAQTPDGAEAVGTLDSALKACANARGLAFQLLTFAKGGAPVIKPIDLRPLLAQTVEFSSRGSRAHCIIELGDVPLIVKADPDQVAQVIQNLVINAVQAMPEGGSVGVRAGVVSLEADEVPPLGTGVYVRVTVSDTGMGIPPENLDKVFDPFFTTKPEGRGLGLAVCLSIMVKHGGSIKVKSALGRGTVFVLHLPAVSAEVPSVRETHPACWVGGGRILVMDDDPEVVRTLTGLLRQLGCEVEAVGDGKAALDAYVRQFESGKPFDAVILDLTIPGGMGGKDTMRKLSLIDPKARVIVTSGYANDPVMSEYAAYGFTDALIKPYRLEDVSEVLLRVRGPRNLSSINPPDSRMPGGGPLPRHASGCQQEPAG